MTCVTIAERIFIIFLPAPHPLDVESVRPTIPNFRLTHKNSRAVADSWNVDSAVDNRRIRSITYARARAPLPHPRSFSFSLSVSFALSCRLLFCFDEKLGRQPGCKRWRVYSKVYCKNCTDREANRVRTSGFKNLTSVGAHFDVETRASRLSARPVVAILRMYIFFLSTPHLPPSLSHLPPRPNVIISLVGFTESRLLRVKKVALFLFPRKRKGEGR